MGSGVVRLQDRRKRWAIVSCMDLMSHVEDVNDLLSEGSEAGDYNMTAINAITEEITEGVDSVSCNEQESVFLIYLTEKMENGTKTLNLFLTTTTTTTTTTSTLEQKSMQLVSTDL